ncbi:MAG: UDP-glucuronic acid decarboxylase family protein [Pseudomonadota bacterium]
MSRRILVTGGAGFLGSHLIDALLHRGDEVTCLDNFYTGSKDNLHKAFASDRFRLLEQDVCDPINVEVDQIYNLASPASPVQYQTEPIKTTMTNVLGTKTVLDLALASGARVLQASTSEVYGDPQVRPQAEDYVGHVNVCGPRACYDEGKRCAETLCFDYERQHGLSVRVARIFNTYGPRMQLDDGRVVSNFSVQALQDQSITLYGDGQQTRSFCYVSDMVDGLMALMNHAADGIGPVNLGNSNEISIETLASLIISRTKSKSEVVRKDLPKDDPKYRCPDIAKAKRLLSWAPAVDLEQGLEKTIRYFLGHFEMET